MATHILRGFLTPNGTVELLDPLPEGIPDAQEVAVLVQTESPTLYKRLNEYGDSVWVDTVNGIEYPETPLSLEEFFQTFGPIWADRRDEMGDPVEWIKQQRQREEERADPWRGQTLS